MIKKILNIILGIVIICVISVTVLLFILGHYLAAICAIASVLWFLIIKYNNKIFKEIKNGKE